MITFNIIVDIFRHNKHGLFYIINFLCLLEDSRHLLKLSLKSRIYSIFVKYIMVTKSDIVCQHGYLFKLSIPYG